MSDMKKLSEIKARFLAALEEFENNGIDILMSCLRENNLDGDVIYNETNQVGILEISECKRPLNGNFHAAFYPYTKNGSKYTTATIRFPIIPEDENTLKVLIKAFRKAD